MDPAEQLDLLRRHAPVLCFDARELFYPTAVETYIATSALVADGQEVLGPGEVTVEHLDYDLADNAYLRFVSDQDRRLVVKEEVSRLARKLLGPRLGRVGFFGRVLDGLFTLGVLIRPTTPRLTTVAAALKAEKYDLHREPVCYGRVVSVSGWLVLHYSYFYVMNDWRSGYRGLNDHEADWEQAWIFCDPDDLQPTWVMASSHENLGANLRRHWDDTECVRMGEHPVLYVGAGSHALFFRPGDYVTRIDIPGFRWMLRVRRWSRRALRIRDEDAERGLGPALGVPFVDAAPGDGKSIEQWDLRHLDEESNWCGVFRGLWGLDTGDPINSERGPSGPKFDRDGRIRRSWADPVGFAGLYGATPSSANDPAMNLNQIRQAHRAVVDEIAEVSLQLSLVANGAKGEQGQVDADELSELLRRKVELEDLERRVSAGYDQGYGIRDHLTDPAVPMGHPKETGWLLALWAALSVPLLISGLAVPFFLRDVAVVGPLLLAFAVLTLLEQLVRRRIHAVLRLAGVYVAIGLFFGFVGVLSLSLYVGGFVLSAGALLLLIYNLGELQAMRKRAN